ncbi:MAG: hypothetical protein MJ057_02680 [Sphaerochaetaceae bacterium]|nr:hypothetical protein [Sphaerochaetaceae bacterium]
MRKVIILLLVFFALVSISTVFAADSVNAIIYPLESSIYDNMDALYSLCGMVKPSTNRPWSDAQARRILSRVDAVSLSRVALSLYDEILKSLDEGLRWKFSDDFQLSAGINFGLDLYAHSNPDQFNTETDWERSYHERQSLMKVYFEFTSGDYFYTTSDIHYKWSRADYNDHYGKYIGSNKLSKDGYVGSYKPDDTSYYVDRSYWFTQRLGTNFFTNTMNFSFIWPKRAVFSLGGDRWNFSINRDVLSMGNANFGNLLVDSHDFSDFARLTMFGDYFNYDLVLMFLNTLVSDNEQHATTEGRMFMIHTLQFRAWDRISFTASENVMYKYENFDPLYLNPAFIYHNLNNRAMFNALAYLEVNASVLPGLEVYAQYAMDQARAPHEGDNQSDASGIVAGVQYTNALGNGVLTSYAEFASTTPLLYRRDIVDFIRVNRYWSHSALDGSFGGGHVPFFDYIGFPYGGDCLMLELRSTYTSLANWKASAFARAVEKGNMNMFKSHSNSGYNDGDANYAGKTPSGAVIKQFVVCGLEFDADLDEFFKWPGVKLSCELDWIGRCDYEKASKSRSNMQSDVQFTMGISVEV